MKTSLRLKFDTVVLSLMLLVIGSLSCQDTGKGYSGKVESITIGMDPTAVNSLIYIAEGQNYFTSNGLKVTIKNYASGLAAVMEC
jgi:ABC-type nitrate/sulfonate/bicarbonate transport system substrate-binding protein